MREIEFSVFQVQEGKNRKIIDGRCYRGPIRLGDRFTALYRLVPVAGDDPFGPSRKVDERAVAFTVVEIRAYGHKLGQLDPGMTARLELSGEDMVEAGFVLGLSGERRTETAVEGKRLMKCSLP